MTFDNKSFGVKAGRLQSFLAGSRAGLLGFTILALFAASGVSRGQGYLADEMNVSGDVYVGWNWSFSVVSDGDSGTVTGCVQDSCTPFGSVDVDGSFPLSGTFGEGDEGWWSETWSIGSDSVGSLSFNLHPADCKPMFSPTYINFNSVDFCSGGVCSSSSEGSGSASVYLPSSFCQFGMIIPSSNLPRLYVTANSSGVYGQDEGNTTGHDEAGTYLGGAEYHAADSGGYSADYNTIDVQDFVSDY